MPGNRNSMGEATATRERAKPWQPESSQAVLGTAAAGAQAAGVRVGVRVCESGRGSEARLESLSLRSQELRVQESVFNQHPEVFPMGLVHGLPVGIIAYIQTTRPKVTPPQLGRKDSVVQRGCRKTWVPVQL